MLARQLGRRAAGTAARHAACRRCHAAAWDGGRGGAAVAVEALQAAEPQGDLSTSSSSSAASSSPEADLQTQQEVLNAVLHRAQQCLERYELGEAERYLQLVEELLGHGHDAVYLHLLALLRLKQGRLPDAVAARDTLFAQHPRLVADPTVLCNAAWLAVEAGDVPGAEQFLARLQSGPGPMPPDHIYVRALVLSSKGHFEAARLLLRSIVKTREADFRSPLDLRVALLYSELLVLEDKPGPSHEVITAAYAASQRLLGKDHVLTLCMAEGMALALRGLRRPWEAYHLLKPVVNRLRDRLGSHRLVATAMGTLCRCQLDIVVYLHTTGTNGDKLLRALKIFDDAVARWLFLAGEADPDGPQVAQAKELQALGPALWKRLAPYTARTTAEAAPPPPRASRRRGGPRGAE